MALRSVSDADVWWHLRAGADLLAGRPGAFVESWSFTAAGRPWINHEWLAELDFGLAYRVAGGAGVVFFTALVMAAVALFLVRAAALERLPAPLIAFGLALAALVAGSRFIPRPQILTYLCLAILLERLASERARVPTGPHRLPRPAFLVTVFVLQVIWTNAHGPVPGLAIGSLLVLGGALPGLSLAGRASVVAALGLASVVHPQGWRPLVEYIPHLLQGGLYQSRIREWLPLLDPEQAGLAEVPATWLAAGLAAAAGLFGLLYPGGRRGWGYAILLLGLAAAPFSSVRHRDLLAIALVPAVAALVGAVRHRRPLVLPVPVALLASGAAIVLLVIPGLGLYRYPATWPPRPELSEAEFPSAAADFIEASPVGSRIFNAYDYGGYLVHRLAPIEDTGEPMSHKVFIDGRYFVYGEALYAEYLEIRDGNDRARQLLEARGADLLVVRYPEADGYQGLAARARTWPDWALVFWDDVTLVYAARAGLSPDWLARNAFVKLDPTLPETMNDPDYWRIHYGDLVREARRASRLAPRAIRPLLVQALAFEYNGRDGDAAAAYEAVLRHDSANRPARDGLARLKSRHPHGLPPAYTEAERNAFDGSR
jgi:hypothetical protein